MQEGVLGLILLWGLVFGSIAYGSTKEAIKESALVQYNHLLQMLFFISFVFFIWAIFNTASNQSLDLGVISLGAVFVTTGIGLCHAPYGTSADGSRTDAFFVAIACALVAGYPSQIETPAQPCSVRPAQRRTSTEEGDQQRKGDTHIRVCDRVHRGTTSY